MACTIYVDAQILECMKVIEGELLEMEGGRLGAVVGVLINRYSLTIPYNITGIYDIEVC